MGHSQEVSLEGIGSFCVVNLGCKVNRVEADAIGAKLRAYGLSMTEQAAADLIVVNTCTVTGEADKKARKAVHHALSANDRAIVLVTGCAVAIHPSAYGAMGNRVRIMSKRAVEEWLGGFSSSDLLRTGEGFRTRVGLKVQDGCDHACTYCIVHTARGLARSTPSGVVLEEARVYFDSGIKELVLTGIDLGAYDDGAMRLSGLVKELVKEAALHRVPAERPARIRISSIEPMSIDDGLIDAMAAAEGRVCRHLHVPLQSGSSRVLGEMGRPYDAEGFMRIMGKLKECMPPISLSTDIIVGFPGETDEDFEATCKLVREVGFSRLHVFPYSPREGTPAAARGDQIAPEAKRKRAARLREIGLELHELDRQKRKGTKELALVEETSALTESYHELPLEKGWDNGSLIEVEL